MADKIRFYELPECPDPAHAGFGAIEARPREAMWAALTHLLRYLSGLAPGAATACLRFVFEPTNADPQSRLRVLLGVRAQGRRLRDAITTLITRGSFGHFFNLQPTTVTAVPRELAAACHIFRSHKRHASLVSSEFNAGVPDAYFSCSPFVANEQNDWTALDRMLDGVHEKVMIDIVVEPTDSAKQREGHGRYLAQLQRIGRTWNPHDDLRLTEDPLGEEQHSRDEHIELTPLHHADPTAQEVQREQQVVHDLLTQSQFAFSLVVLAESEESARLIGSTLAEAAFLEGSYELCVHADGLCVGRIKDQLGKLQLLDPTSVPLLRAQTEIATFSDLVPLLHMASVDELAGVFRFPVASCGSPCCIRKNTDPPPHPADGACVVLGWDAVGSQSSTKMVRGIPFNTLCRHICSTGTTGSGKTTALLNLILQLWRQQVPVLVLEPVKTEFRVLKRLAGGPREEISELARDLEIYTPGNESLSPLRFNPLERHPGVTEHEQMDAVIACFEAAIPMSGPLPAILREALEEAYDTEQQPTVMSLLHAAERALLRKRYSASTYADLRGALDTRLGSLTRGNMGRVLRCVHSLPPIERLMTKPIVIEMDLLSREQACLLTLLLLLRIRQAVRTPAKAMRHPRLVIIIDEAHNLVGTDTNAEPSEDNPKPKAYASESICGMLAEMRARGVAVVISDQTPSAVAAEVIKLPATKLAFQQLDEADRAVVGSAMLFKKNEFEDIARLQPGEAYLFTTGYHGPRKIRTVNLHEQMDLRRMDDEELRGIIRAEPWQVEMTKARLGMDLQALTACMDTFDEQRVKCAAQAARLCAKYPQAVGMRDPSRRHQALASIQKHAINLKEQLREAHRQFRMRDYAPLLPSADATAMVGAELNLVRADLVARYETVIQPDTRQCLAILDHLTETCGVDAEGSHNP